MFQITLRAARINCGMDLKDVSQLTGKNVETISKYEKDSTKIPRDLMEELIQIYGVPKEYIFFGKESVFTVRKQKQNTA